ncbi:MAG: dihydroorotase [Bacteroidia bacterium]
MKTLIKNAKLVNEGRIYYADVLIKGQFIEKIDENGIAMPADIIIDATDQYLLPGVIDDQVHFREPGLAQKGEIATESVAAVAGGITSYMEMPNTKPSAVTIELLEQKYARAAQCSLANYSFYMGTTNTNLNELLKVDPTKICGVKIFMGSSTGDMLVDDPIALECIFSEVKTLIATHCEDDPMIKANMAEFVAKYGKENLTPDMHPLIRSGEACYKSSSFAVELAKKFGTRLHILHISTAEELDLFDNKLPLADKKITAEACIHHLWFCNDDYKEKGNFIKWNPAVKTAADREAILKAVIDNRIDVIATDHAPHTIAEKQEPFFNAPSGGPLVQHSLNAMIHLYQTGKISLEKIVEKMCHNVAIMFEIDRRGFIREGFYADLVLVNLNKPYKVNKENILYKCGWSPFEGFEFNNSVTHTFVNGHLAFKNGKINSNQMGMRLAFNR